MKADGTTITAEHSAKERLVAAATRIFFRDGFRATGIQAVLAAADVSKMTLYRHFKSKDDLVLETLTRYDQRFQAWLCERAKQNLDPRLVLLSIFDGLHDLVSGKAFPDIGAVGCPFVRAALENGDPDNPVHELVADHIRQIQDCIGELCKRMRVNNSDALAKSLFLEFQGAYLTVMMTGKRSIISDAKEMAAFLIEADSSS